jgi:hypothetical protein
MHGGWQLFSPTLLVEVERILLIRWISLYAHAIVWRRGEREKHTRALACLASQVHNLILPFIFATSLCLIRFDRDRPRWLWDAVTLGGSSI